MDIWLLVAIVAVGASGLYVAVTFNKRTRQHTDPLVSEATRVISKQTEDSGKALRKQLDEITTELQQERDLVNRERSRTQERLDHADRRISSIADRFSAELDIIKRQCAQIGTWQDQFGGNLQQQLDHQGAQLSESLVRLSESLDRLSAQVAGIETYARSQEPQTAARLEKIEGSIQDMGTR